ncbi:MAG TPA: glycosyltransferase family 2 protein [Trueperaceae bacterium]
MNSTGFDGQNHAETRVEVAVERLPFVSIVLPIRNEERHIRACLTRLLEQDYPAERYEVVVVDGESDDATPALVREIQREVGSDRLRLLNNPGRIVPVALNIGISAARGEVIVRMDGHTVPERDYVSSCVRALRESAADNVGGPMRPRGETEFGRAVAVALQHPIGVGDARFHLEGESGYVDTVYMGAFRREIFERAGLFDESMVRNQDYEMNVRIRAAGGKIYLDPRIRSCYTPRGSFAGLWKQYFEYGWWRVETIRRHRWSARWRQLLPAAFVAALAGSLLLSPFWAVAALGFGLVVVLYLGALGAATAAVRERLSGPALLRLPGAFVAMHIGYGCGFLLNVVSGGRFPFRAKAPAVPRLESNLQEAAPRPVSA